jgi:SAM-dependent methyltransferase
MKDTLSSIARRTLPGFLHRWVGTQLKGEKYTPPVGKIDFGSLGGLTPISRHFGYDRGLPIDRYYIEKFLSKNAADVKGHVLEIGDNSYTSQFGGDRVNESDVLHIVEGNPQATIVGDLTNAEHIASDKFDCFILTQTLQCIYDTRSAIRTIYRILKPGGVVLATFSGISLTPPDEWGDYWCWNFTSQSGKRLFAEFFPEANIQVESYGNVLAAIAFLQGLATEELDSSELDHRDHVYELLITVRAVKPQETDISIKDVET